MVQPQRACSHGDVEAAEAARRVDAQPDRREAARLGARNLRRSSDVRHRESSHRLVVRLAFALGAVRRGSDRQRSRRHRRAGRARAEGVRGAPLSLRRRRTRDAIALDPAPAPSLLVCEGGCLEETRRRDPDAQADPAASRLGRGRVPFLRRGGDSRDRGPDRRADDAVVTRAQKRNGAGNHPRRSMS